MIRVALTLEPGEAKALRVLCRRFRFEDALQFLHGVPNISPDALCEAITHLGEAIDRGSNLPRSR